MLQLEVPIMVTDLRFVEDENQIIEATKLHEVVFDCYFDFNLCSYISTSFYVAFR